MYCPKKVSLLEGEVLLEIGADVARGGVEGVHLAGQFGVVSGLDGQFGLEHEIVGTPLFDFGEFNLVLGGVCAIGVAHDNINPIGYINS